jgi:hypothetical protein
VGVSSGVGGRDGFVLVGVTLLAGEFASLG